MTPTVPCFKLASSYDLFKDLLKDLKSEISGDYQDVVEKLLESAAQYDAWLLHETMDVSYPIRIQGNKMCEICHC